MTRSRYRQSSPAPWIAAGVLFVALVGVVVWGTQKKDPDADLPVATSAAPASTPAPVAAPVPAPVPVEVPAAEPPPPRLSAAQAEKRLRKATKAWRAFTLKLCQEQKWPTPRAMAFLKKVTFSDRDLEKQHENGLAAIRRMLGVESDDPVALAEALAEQGDLQSFFAGNWSKVDVDWKPPPKVEGLQDAWRPNRIRWGFPLDTPVEELQAFKRTGLKICLDSWHSLAWSWISNMDMDETSKRTKWELATGTDVPTQEIKLRAAFQVLLDKPGASLKELVETFVLKTQDEGQREEFLKALAQNVDAAVKAAEAAKAE